MLLSRPIVVALVLRCLAVFTACHATGGDSTAPPLVSFDAEHGLAKVNPVAVFDQPIFASFVGAESFFERYFRSDLTATLTTAASGNSSRANRLLFRTVAMDFLIIGLAWP